MNAITKIIKQMLSIMDIKAETGIIEDSDINLTFFNIQTKEPNLLIGYKGETLLALSHVLKKIYDANSKEDEKLPFIVDVNGYQKKRIDEIKDKATILVERARYYKSSVEMDPMSPYERMIVHSIFSQDSQIKTESTGIGRDRRVVIEYVGD